MPRSGAGDSKHPDGTSGRDVGVHEQLVEQLQRVGLATQPLAVRLPQIHELARLADGCPRRLLHPDQEKVEPSGPVPLERLVRVPSIREESTASRLM